MDSSSFNELRLDTGPAEEDGLDSGTDVERVRNGTELVNEVEPKEAHTENASDVGVDTTNADDCMPAEYLVSDDSDVAGRYSVTEAAMASTSAAAASGGSYQRLDISSHSSSSSAGRVLDFDSSDGDAFDPYEELQMRAGQEDEQDSSEESSADAEPDLSLLHVGKARAKGCLMQNYRKREYGDLKGSRGHSNYEVNTMSNLSFVRRLKCVKTLEHHEGCVNSLSFNQSGTLLASGSDDMKAVIWDMSTSKPYMVFDTGHKSNVFQTKFMPYSNDSQLVTCARDGQVRLSELSTTGTCRGSKRLAFHKGSAHKLAVEYDTCHCLMSAGEDAVVYEIDLRQPKPNRLLQVRNGRQKIPLHSIDINPSHSHEFLVSGKDHFIRLYDKRRLPSSAACATASASTSSHNTDLHTLHKFYPHKFSDASPFKRDVTCAVYSYNGSEVLGTYNDDDIYLFNNTNYSHSGSGEESPDFCHMYTGHRNSATVKGVNFFGPHSEYVVSGSDCGNVFIWDKESTQAVQLQKGDDGGVVNVLEPHPRFPYLATSGLDNDIKLFMPVSEDYVDMIPHAKLMRKNVSDRNRNQAEEVNGQLLWLVMQQLRRARRRRQREAAGEDCEDSNDSSCSSSNSSSSGDEEPVSCITS